MTKIGTKERDAIPATQFAFPKQRKEPLENATHVRNAIARFDQVQDVSDAERDTAWKHIRAAAKRFHVEVKESSWRELGSGQSRGHAKALANTHAATRAAA
jgi:hypothetical protein